MGNSERIGVLGHSGFVGLNLRDYLTRHGYDWVGASRSTGVDARNYQDVLDWIRDNKVNRVVNLAAICGGIGLNREKPAELWSATTLINHAVLSAAVTAGVDNLLMVGTVCCYAKHCPVPFTEDDLMNHGPPEETNAPYGVAKLSGLWGAKAHHDQYGLPCAYVVPENLYGPHDHFNLESSHVIPALIKKFVDAQKEGRKSVTCWGTGSASREFLYAPDAAEAMVKALFRIHEPIPMNLASDGEVKILTLAEKIADAAGFDGEIVWDTSKPDGQPRRAVSSSRAADMLGWRAQTNLSEGLQETVDWYRQKYVS